MTHRTLLTLAIAALAVGPVSALNLEVKEVRASAATVRTTIQLHDFVPDRFQKLIDRGGQLHLRLQAELWESRPVWDRLVYPAIIRVFRVSHRPASRDITIDDSAGRSTSYGSLPNPMDVTVDLGNRDRVIAAEQYYVHVVATIGTLADREADDVGDAVFGKDSDTNALGSFGRMVFRTALKVSDYLQSVSADVKSRKMPGTEITRP
jgi:hypothetical protein